jgi:hypothetical protein
MNLLGLCQGKNGQIFFDFQNNLKSIYDVEKVGVFIADSYYYINEFNSKYDDDKFLTLKEWEVYGEALKIKTSNEVINKWSNYFLDDFTLWEAALADRRVIYGEFCKVTDDLKSRYTHEEIVSLICHSLDRIEKLFNELEPDCIIGFAPVTLIEVLIIQYAIKNGIKIFLIRSSKIDDRIVFFDNYK